MPSDPTPEPNYKTDLIPRILMRNSINLLAGAPGTGKTALLAYILTRFRDGLTVFGHHPAPLSAIAFIGADRSWDESTHLWFDAVGYPDLIHDSLQDDRVFNPRRLKNKHDRIVILEERLDKLNLPKGALVCVDPIALFLGGNLNDYDTCAVHCSIIRRLCQDRGLTMIGTAHSAKQMMQEKDRYLRLQDRILGSTGLFAYTDTQMYLASPEETGEKFYSFLWHSHHAPPELFPLGRDAKGLFVPYHESVRSQDEGKVLACISEAAEGTAFADILIASEVSRPTTHRYIQELIKEGLIERVGHGKYRKLRLS